LNVHLSQAGRLSSRSAGLATQFSVEHTLRYAADRGFRVTVLRDCCASANARGAEAAFEVTSMLAEVAESTDWP
jgi:biuret amidohydrolase